MPEQNRKFLIIFFIALNLYAFSCVVKMVNVNHEFSKRLFERINQAAYLAETTDWDTFDERGIGDITLYSQMNDELPRILAVYHGETKGAVFVPLKEELGKLKAVDTSFSTDLSENIYESTQFELYGTKRSLLIKVLFCLGIEAFTATLLNKSRKKPLPSPFTAFRYIIIRLMLLPMPLAILGPDAIFTVKKLCLLIAGLWILETTIYITPIIADEGGRE